MSPVSAACNIVEGCARRGENEYLNFRNIAAGSASEARHLVELSCRLGFYARLMALRPQTRTEN